MNPCTAPRGRVRARPWPPWVPTLPRVRECPAPWNRAPRGPRGCPTPGELACRRRSAAPPIPALPRPARRPLCWRSGSCPAPPPAAAAAARPPPCSRLPARRALTRGQQEQQRRQPSGPQHPAHGAAVAARSHSGAAPRPASGAARAAAAARARPIGPRGRHSTPAPPGRVPRARPRVDEAGARAFSPLPRSPAPAGQSEPRKPLGGGVATGRPRPHTSCLVGPVDTLGGSRPQPQGATTGEGAPGLPPATLLETRPARRQSAVTCTE